MSPRIVPPQRQRKPKLRGQQIALLFLAGVGLHLFTNDRLVLMVSSTAMKDHHPDDTRQNMASSENVQTRSEEVDDHEHRIPRGAAEALHDDALSQLPTLTILQVGGWSGNNAHSMNRGVVSDDDEDVFLPWDSVTSNHRRRRRRHPTRRIVNISNILNSITPSTNSTNTTRANLEMIEEFIDDAVKRDHIPNHSISTSIITDDNTTPTTIIISEVPSTASPSSSKKEKDRMVEAVPDVIAKNATGSLTKASLDLDASDEGSIPTLPNDEKSTVEVDEEEDGEIGSVAVDYASKSAGAIILEKSQSFKGTSNLLNSDRDKYAIAPCQDKKYVVIGLSEDILVKTVKLANYERYSSHLKSFSIWGSQTTKEWVDLGTYQARFGLGEQSFDLIQPSWARYLKFKFLAHYGSEHYCTISQIKVHGRTMVQGFHEQWIQSQEEDEESSGEVVAGADASSALPESDSSDSRVHEKRVEVDKAQNPAELRILSSKRKDSSLGTNKDSHIRLINDIVEVDLDDLSTEYSSLDNNNATCDVLHGFSYVHNGVLQSASFVLSSTSRIAHGSPSRVIPEIAKGALFSRITVPASIANQAHALREAASRSIGSSPLFSAAVERIQVVATALGDSLDINVSSLGRLRRKSSSEGNDSETETATSIHTGDVDSAEKEPVASASKASEDVPNDSTTDSSPPTPINSSHDTDKTVSKEQSTPQRLSNDELASPDALHELPPLVLHTLRRLPSSDCLKKLDYSEFQAKVAATRKGGSKNHGASPSGNAIEPIFKTLTDQIKALQLNLSVHDQFTKASITCYQRVLADLALEMESIRAIQDARIMKLESDIQELKSLSLLILIRNFAVAASVVLHFVTGTIVECMVRAELDIPLKWRHAVHALPSATSVAFIACTLLALAVLSRRPKKFGKVVQSVKGKVQTRRLKKRRSSPQREMTKDESFVVLTQESASGPTPA